MNMFGDEPLGTTSVIANIYPMGSRAPATLRAKLRNIEIPAGDDFNKWQTVSLPSGSYELQVSLPSGELLTKDIEIPSDAAESIDVAVESPSPHEWLAYQHFMGNVHNRTRRVRTRDEKLETFTMKIEESVRKNINWSYEKLAEPGISANESSAGAPLDSGELATSMGEQITPSDFDVTQVNSAVGDSLWQILVDAIQVNDTPYGTSNRLSIELNPSHLSIDITPYIDDEFVETYRFTLDGPLKMGDASTNTRSAWDGAIPERAFILISNEETAKLICAPLPWFDLSSGLTNTAFEMISPRGDVDVTTAIRDTELGSIIGYLTQNSFANARKLVDNAEGMLFHKFSNPIGAAAGAYVMLSTETQRPNHATDADWHRWVENLYLNFPWIPDGAIAYSTLKLNHQTEDSHVEEALNGLIEAYNRGIPFYSIGMRWLLDGLTAFAEDDTFIDRHDEIKECLRKVSIVARRTNYLQAFTNIEITKNRH